MVLLLLVGGCPESTTLRSDAAVDDAGMDSGARVGRPAGPLDAGTDAFVDRTCGADASTGSGMFQRECDPFDDTTCAPDEACQAAAIPPREPCGEELFVTFCARAGSGQQGDDCLGEQSCAAGFSCVVTGAGTQCARNCDLGGGEPSCPRGNLCQATDVPGYGACF